MPPRHFDGPPAAGRRVPVIDIRSLLAANPFVAAPMDGYSDYPFRAICRQSGAGLTFTEMIPAIALTFGAPNSAVTIGYVTWSSMMSGARSHFE